MDHILICCVCLGDNSEDADEIIQCDNCGITVHEGNRVLYSYCGKKACALLLIKYLFDFLKKPEAFEVCLVIFCNTTWIHFSGETSILYFGKAYISN